MSRKGHRAIVRAALAWYAGTVDRAIGEPERAKRYRALRDACAAAVHRGGEE